MRHAAERGFNSIGVVATQKVPSDPLNLGFPAAYQSVYAAHQPPPRFLPEAAPYEGRTFWKGNDLQAAYHEGKMREAHRMAAAKVRATQLSRVRYCSTPHGRGVLPAAVLAQRQFANQSNGAYFTSSARRDQPGAPFTTIAGATMSGGVLRSPAGQRYGQEVLRRRVGQLDAIQQAAQDFGALGPLAQQLTRPAAMAQAATETELPSVNEASAIELNLLLEGVLNALYSTEPTAYGETGGDQLTRFTLGDATRALLLIFRMVPTAPSDFAEDLMGKVETILNLLNGILDPETESAGMKVEAKQIALTLQVLFTKLRTYLERMMGGATVERVEERFNPLTNRSERVRVVSAEQGANLTAKERVALSRNLVKELGFSKMLKYRDDQYNALLSMADRERLMTAQQAERFAEGDMDDGSDEDDGYSSGGSDDGFDRPALAREDEQHRAEGNPRRGDRAAFDRDERVDFGDNQGLMMGPGGAQFAANQYIDEEEAPPLDAGEEAVAEAEAQPVRRVMGDAPEVRGLFDAAMGAYDIAVARPRAAPALPAPRALPPPPPAAAAAAAGPQILVEGRQFEIGSEPLRQFLAEYRAANEGKNPLKYRLINPRTGVAGPEKEFAKPAARAAPAARSVASSASRARRPAAAAAAARSVASSSTAPSSSVALSSVSGGPSTIAARRAMEGKSPAVRAIMERDRAALQAARAIVPDRSALPSTRAEYQALAARLRDVGFQIRVSAQGKPTSIRANFIKRLGL